MKTLVILAHPNMEHSRVNKRWRQELLLNPDEVTVHELYQEYPDWNIDVSKEQKLLETHQCIILQFPLYWYSYPPLLKKWLDDVLTRGWAYGSMGNALHGKKFGIAISIGNKKENYSQNGSITFTVDEIIAPFKATTIYIGAAALPHFSFFGASFQVTDEEIEQSAKDYMDYIRKYNFLSMIESKPEIFRKL